MHRWEEYIKELYEDNRNDTDLNYNNEGPSILNAEVKEAIQHLKNNKSSGPVKITKEELDALGDYDIEVIIKILNDIYNSGYIPSDLLQSIFMAYQRNLVQ